MGIAEEMRVLTQNVIDSYEMRVKIVTALMRQTNELIKSFRLEQEDMASQLRERLAKNECLRKKDFEAMIESIQVQQREKEKEVDEMLKKIHQEEKEMVTELRAILVSDNETKMKNFKVIKENILTRQKEREREVSETLRDLHQEHEELSIALRKLLSKGESVKIKDFKAMVKTFQVQRRKGRNEVGQMLEEFRRVREEISAEWEKVISTTRGGGLTPLSIRK